MCRRQFLSGCISPISSQVSVPQFPQRSMTLICFADRAASCHETHPRRQTRSRKMPGALPPPFTLRRTTRAISASRLLRQARGMDHQRFGDALQQRASGIPRVSPTNPGRRRRSFIKAGLVNSSKISAMRSSARARIDSAFTPASNRSNTASRFSRALTTMRVCKAFLVRKEAVQRADLCA